MARRKHIPTYRLYKASGRAVVTLTDAISGVPAGFLVLMVASGTSTVAQFNAGRPGGYGLWSAWVADWPVCLDGVPAGLALVSVGFARFLVRPAERGPLRRERARPGYAALTGVHLLFAGRPLLRFPPNA